MQVWSNSRSDSRVTGWKWGEWLMGPTMCLMNHGLRMAVNIPNVARKGRNFELFKFEQAKDGLIICLRDKSETKHTHTKKYIYIYIYILNWSKPFPNGLNRPKKGVEIRCNTSTVCKNAYGNFVQHHWFKSKNVKLIIRFHVQRSTNEAFWFWARGVTR